MSILFDIPHDFKCIGCGATHSQQSKGGELCVTCHGTFIRWTKSVGSKDFSKNGLNRWLARKLFLDSEHLIKYGVGGRCEAVAKGPKGWRSGGINSQCCRVAISIRNGRRVCAAHRVGRSNHVIFIGGTEHNPYLDMEQSLERLARFDPRFRECLTNVSARIQDVQ